ncbi:MAG: hypothetical protein Q8Q88_00700 [Phenylobacterium sp.]|uniref:hypothetical protein n=1 Tax=Phenylobacterium sp. TaxID=1871053 RepID=UPI0027352A61|nr:hypothetical protein [Phenylobacterium sp.]MDP3745543.1 hypothetical protein [Phenylobacterium sp.]
MIRLATLTVAVVVTMTGEAAAQTCLSVLGCAASSAAAVVGAPAPGSPNSAFGVLGSNSGALALPTADVPLLFDNLGNMRGKRSGGQDNPAPTGLDAGDAGKRPATEPKNPTAATGNPGAPRLEAIPQGPK